MEFAQYCHIVGCSIIRVIHYILICSQLWPRVNFLVSVIIKNQRKILDTLNYYQLLQSAGKLTSLLHFNIHQYLLTCFSSSQTKTNKNHKKEEKLYQKNRKKQKIHHYFSLLFSLISWQFCKRNRAGFTAVPLHRSRTFHKFHAQK